MDELIKHIHDWCTIKNNENKIKILEHEIIKNYIIKIEAERLWGLSTNKDELIDIFENNILNVKPRMLYSFYNPMEIDFTEHEFMNRINVNNQYNSYIKSKIEGEFFNLNAFMFDIHKMIDEEKIELKKDTVDKFLYIYDWYMSEEELFLMKEISSIIPLELYSNLSELQDFSIDATINDLQKIDTNEMIASKQISIDF